MNARLHKVELYVLDPNGNFDTVSNFIDHLDYNIDDVFFKVSNEKTVEFDWDDDLDINSDGATKEDFEKYF